MSKSKSKSQDRPRFSDPNYDLRERVCAWRKADREKRDQKEAEQKREEAIVPEYHEAVGEMLAYAGDIPPYILRKLAAIHTRVEGTAEKK